MARAGAQGCADAVRANGAVVPATPHPRCGKKNRPESAATRKPEGAPRDHRGPSLGLPGAGMLVLLLVTRSACLLTTVRRIAGRTWDAMLPNVG